MYDGVYNKGRNKIHNNNSTKEESVNGITLFKVFHNMRSGMTISR